MSDLRVYKTLVIGLGSTGTRVCEELADRIDGEIGSLERAPWVEFLCLETDVSQRSPHFQGTDNFRTLSISPDVYSDILSNPHNYDDSIALTRWADLETLKQIPGKAVNTGAGNIRMVGRLALLYPDNYKDIKLALEARLAKLRDLTAAQAKVKLNHDAVGHETEISFASQMDLRIFVVGTLMGGTCSGSASDMGILLQTMLNGDEKAIGMFTLPHPQYSITQDDKAELRKTNAYHALQELNQYLNYKDAKRYSSIKFPDKVSGEPVLTPDTPLYDLVYLVRPRNNTKEDEPKLNSAVADRIFLNIFVPDVDLFSKKVDGGTPPPKDGRSFAFATFGLSTIEYPVRRIIEACKLKSLTHALRKWKDRDLVGKLEDQLDELGLNAPTLLELLMRDSGGASIRSQLEGQTRKVVAAAKRGDLAGADKALEEFRGAFSSQKGSGEGLSGLASRTVQQNRARAAQEITGGFGAYLRARLLDYDIGPSPLLALMNGVTERVGALRAWEASEVKPSAAGNVLERIGDIRRNTLLGMFFLKNKAMRRHLKPLEKSLRDELNARLEQLAKGVLFDSGVGTKIEKGTLSLIDSESRVLAKRLRNLKTRLDRQTYLWSTQANDLENRKNDINGLALFEVAPNGTVDKEFKKALPDGEIDRLGASIVASWLALGDGVMPSDNQPDWLSASYNPGQAAFEIPQLMGLERIAVEPFKSLDDPHNKDIATRLFEATSTGFDPEQAARGAAGEARVFLPIQDNLGQPDPMSPLPKRKVMLGRNIPERLKSALTQWRTVTPGATVSEIDNPFRIVMLEEWWNFSLRGSLDITTTLASAKSDLFSTYFTRKREDIDWTPLSDSEIKELQDAEQLIILGILHGILKPERGQLFMDWPKMAGESDDPLARRRGFALDIGKAARTLAFDLRDQGGRSLANARVLLNSRIEEVYRTQFLKKYDTPARAAEAYVLFLNTQQLEGEGHIVRGWEPAVVQKLLVKYCRKDNELIRALFKTFPPDSTLIQSLHRQNGERRPKGNGVFPEDGYYCKVCGGSVGLTHDQVLENALQCGYHPDDPQHPFGRSYDFFAGTTLD